MVDPDKNKHSDPTLIGYIVQKVSRVATVYKDGKPVDHPINTGEYLEAWEVWEYDSNITIWADRSQLKAHENDTFSTVPEAEGTCGRIRLIGRYFYVSRKALGGKGLKEFGFVRTGKEPAFSILALDNADKVTTFKKAAGKVKSGYHWLIVEWDATKKPAVQAQKGKCGCSRTASEFGKGGVTKVDQFDSPYDKPRKFLFDR